MTLLTLAVAAGLVVAGAAWAAGDARLAAPATSRRRGRGSRRG